MEEATARKYSGPRDPLVTSASHNRFTSSRLSWISSRTRFCSALASAEYRPCFQRARRDLANPSGVRGPVLAPPCIRHRPLRIAGARHAVPRRVLAPHLGAVFGSETLWVFFPSLCNGFDEILGFSTMASLRWRAGCTFRIKNLDVTLEEQFHLLA